MYYVNNLESVLSFFFFLSLLTLIALCTISPLRSKCLM